MLISEALSSGVAYESCGSLRTNFNSAWSGRGVERTKLYITNAVSCRPSIINSYLEEISCVGRLVKELTVKPKLIVTLSCSYAVNFKAENKSTTAGSLL